MKSNFLWLLGVALLCHSAKAETTMEREVRNAPMPHEAQGEPHNGVRVHRVQLQGYLEGSPGNAARLDKLKRDVADCVSMYRRAGRAVRPPTEWPNYLNSLRQDTYYAANRIITYSSGIAYGLNPADCSLLEGQSSKATLSSSLGMCVVDLKAKKAKGVCPADGHARAAVPAPMAPSPAMQAQAMKQLAANPKLREMVEKAMAAGNSASGEKKRILGVECEVWRHPMGTMCLTKQGSFNPPVFAASDLGYPGVELEAKAEQGVNLNAVSVKLDTTVHPDVFTPYNQPGFSISDKAR